MTGEQKQKIAAAAGQVVDNGFPMSASLTATLEIARQVGRIADEMRHQRKMIDRAMAMVEEMASQRGRTIDPWVLTFGRDDRFAGVFTSREAGERSAVALCEELGGKWGRVDIEEDWPRWTSSTGGSVELIRWDMSQALRQDAESES